MARADLLPTISASFSYGYLALPAGNGFPTVWGQTSASHCPPGSAPTRVCQNNGWFADRNFGVQMSWPLFDGLRAKGNIDLAQAQAKIVKRVPEVDFTYLTVGSGFRGTTTNGQLFVRLKSAHDRKRSMAEIQNAMRPELRMVSGTRASIDGTRSIFGGFRQPIVVNVQGTDPARLKLIAGQVNAIMREVPGMTEPFSSDEGDIPQLAEVRAGVGPQQIERRQLERQISISAGVLPGAAVGDVADRTLLALNSIVLPAGYRTVFTGDVQNLNETKGYVLEALILAVVFIYLILASLFGSFVQPLAIMFSLPLSFLGVALALWITGGTINVMSMIGIIMLMGLVTKNGILLIDFVHHARAEGKARTAAIIEAGRIRLRPIIMTTAAMIFGMLPLALALGESAEQRSPMAHAVIGGLLTSTLLTLFVVPAVYTLLDDLVLWFGQRRTAAVSGTPTPAGGTPASAPVMAGRHPGNPA